MERVSSPNKSGLATPAPPIKFGSIVDCPSDASSAHPSVAGRLPSDNVVLPPRIQSAPPNVFVSPPSMAASAATTENHEKPSSTAPKKPLPVNAAPYQPSASFAPPPPFYAPAGTVSFYPYGSRPKASPAPYNVAHDPALHYATTLFMNKPSALAADGEKAASSASPIFPPPPARKPVRIQNPETGEDVKITTPSIPKLATPSTPQLSPVELSTPPAQVSAPTSPQPTTPVKRGVSIKDPSGNVVELVSRPRSTEAAEQKPLPASPESKVNGESAAIDAAETAVEASDEPKGPDAEFSDPQEAGFEEEEDEELPVLDGLIKPGMCVVYPSRFVPFEIPLTKEEVWRYTRRFLLQFMTICTQRPDKAAEMARLAAVQQRAHPRGRRAPRRVYSEAEKQAYLSQLNRAEHAWTPMTGLGDLAEDERIVRQITGILNKLTIDNFTVLFDELKELRLHGRSESAIKQVIEIVFEKATMEIKFAELYATLCHRLCVFEVECANKGEAEAMAWKVTPYSVPVVSVQKSNFRHLLVSHVEFEYNRKREWSEEQARLAAQGIVVKSLASGDLTDSDLAMIKRKRRVLGNMRFIGELYKQKLISPKIMHETLLGLVGTKGSGAPEEDEVECVCKLFSTVAPSLWDLTHSLTDTAMKHDFASNFALYMQRLGEMSKESSRLSSRIRFMVMDVVESFERSVRASGSPSLSSISQASAPPHSAPAPPHPSSSGAGQRAALEKRRASRDHASPAHGPGAQSPALSRDYGESSWDPSRYTRAQQPFASPAPPAPLPDARKDEWNSSRTLRGAPTGGRPLASPVPALPSTPAASPGATVAAAPGPSAAPKKLLTTARAPSKTPSPTPALALPASASAPSPKTSAEAPPAGSGQRPSTPALSAASSTSLNRFDALGADESASSARPHAGPLPEKTPGEAPPAGALAEPAPEKAFVPIEVEGRRPEDEAAQSDAEQDKTVDSFLANYSGEYFGLKSVAELAFYAKDVSDWTLLVCKWLPFAAEKHSGAGHFAALFVPAFKTVVVDGGHMHEVREEALCSTLMAAAGLQSECPLVFEYYGIFLSRCYAPWRLLHNGEASGKLLKDRLLSADDPLTSSRLLAQFLKHYPPSSEKPLDMSNCPVDFFRHHVAVFERAGVLSAFPRLAKWRFEHDFAGLREKCLGPNGLSVSQVSESVRSLIVAVPSNVLREANLLGDICRLLFSVYRERYAAKAASPASPRACDPAVAAALLSEEWLPQFLATLSPILAVEELRAHDWKSIVLAASRIEDEDSAFGSLLMDGLRDLGIIPAEYFVMSFSPVPSPKQSPSKQPSSL